MKLPPSGYIPTWNDTPRKFHNRMKKRAAEAEEKRNEVGQPAPKRDALDDWNNIVNPAPAAPAPVIPVEERVPPLMPQFGGTLE